MATQTSFFPGRPRIPGPPLAAYRPMEPVGAPGDYVRSFAPAGGLVVDLFCQGPLFVGAAAGAGRRALGFSINPLLLHTARLGLLDFDRDALTAAFTHLADSLKGDVTLRSHVLSLYRAHCPVCHTEGVAEWFAWRRDLDRPFEKAVRCPRCEDVHVGPVDEDDIKLAQSVAPRGLSYYSALDRAAPLGHPVRERAAELVDCYTPRNLSALMALTRRMQNVEAADDVTTALIALLVDCFDRCSRLHSYDDDRPRPRTLRIPVRYLERNVWFCLEGRLSRLSETGTPAIVPDRRDVTELVDGAATGYALVAKAARDVGELLPARSVDLIFVDPPRPDGVFWALSALWAAWLWSSEETRAMRPFLRRRRFDWHWHWRALREAFHVIGPRLTKNGVLVTLFGGPDRAMFRSVCLAASSAGYRLRAWGFAPEVGYRLMWSWKDEPIEPLPVTEALREQAVSDVEGAVISALRSRGEPSSQALLQAAAHARLVERGMMSAIAALAGDGVEDDVSPVNFLTEAVDRGLESEGIKRVPDDGEPGDQIWWLRDGADAAEPLADRVEAVVHQLLTERLMWLEDDLINTVYACFPSAVTPDLELVQTSIGSYGMREDTEVRLRLEDDRERRGQEIGKMRELLIALGRRLGYRAEGGVTWDVCWLEDQRQTYVFAILVTANVAAPLLGGPTPDAGAKRCLVVPGGRAELIHLKLRRDARLARAARSDAWQFMKFRHLRRLMREDGLDRRAFEVVLSLDPIAGREQQQLRLF